MILDWKPGHYEYILTTNYKKGFKIHHNIEQDAQSTEFYKTSGRYYITFDINPNKDTYLSRKLRLVSYGDEVNIVWWRSEEDCINGIDKFIKDYPEEFI